MQPRTRSHPIRLALLLGAAFGCSDVTIPRQDVENGFSVRVSGGITRTLRGGAIFDEDASGPRLGSTIALVDSAVVAGGPSPGSAVYLYRDEEGTPVAGEYALGSGADFRVGLMLDGDDPMLCEAESGALDVSAGSAAGVRGTFAFQGRCYHVGGGPTVESVRVDGSFRAVVGAVAVPADISDVPPPWGRFDLVTAGGKALPTAVFDGIILIGEDEFHHLEITATDGYLELDGEGGYRQRVSQEVRVDGHPSPGLDWVDRGLCTVSRVEMHCLSNLWEGRSVTIKFVDRGLETTEDLNGEGVAVSYRYVWAGR